MILPNLRNYLEVEPQLRPSARGELEITDLNRAYLERGTLTVERLGRGVAWLDTGTADALLQAANFVQIVESRQGLKIACLVEIALNLGYININQVLALATPIANSEYGQYLLQLGKHYELQGKRYGYRRG
jgi:glucose-1-phosphate thymidylyltransferase